MQTYYFTPCFSIRVLHWTNWKAWNTSQTRIWIRYTNNVFKGFQFDAQIHYFKYCDSTKLIGFVITNIFTEASMNFSEIISQEVSIMFVSTSYQLSKLFTRHLVNLRISLSVMCKIFNEEFNLATEIIQIPTLWDLLTFRADFSTWWKFYLLCDIKCFNLNAILHWLTTKSDILNVNVISCFNFSVLIFWFKWLHLELSVCKEKTQEIPDLQIT